MRKKRKEKYYYTTVTIDGKKKSLYLGKPSASRQARDHQHKMEQKRTIKAREQELDQLNKAVDQALHALNLMTRAYLLTIIGLYQRRSEIRTLQEDVKCRTTMH
jgi:hypothetical protein